MCWQFVVCGNADLFFSCFAMLVALRTYLRLGLQPVAGAGGRWQEGWILGQLRLGYCWQFMKRAKLIRLITKTRRRKGGWAKKKWLAKGEGECGGEGGGGCGLGQAGGSGSAAGEH